MAASGLRRADGPAGRRRAPGGGVKAPARSGWPLPPRTSSFSNPEFGLVYLGQGERNLGNLVKKIRDRYPYTKSVGAVFWWV